MAGLYIHIPFCKQACYYCDFHFSTNTSYRTQMIDSISKELEIQKSYLNHETIDTIYFGGGTPSILTSGEIEKLLISIRRFYTINLSPEITLEANPDDLSKEKLNDLKTLGINRLSIGIQSFHDKTLEFLHRAHNSKDAIRCVEDARKVGFDNISLDLIFSIPGQTIADLKEDLNLALTLNPEHISVYSLTIEEKTVFGNWAKKGKFQALTDERSAQQFDFLISKLEDNAYEQYEISNFCRDEKYAIHNTAYWKNINYLGVGPGAHSFNGTNRQYNISNNHSYMKSIEKGEIPFTIDELDSKALANEFLLTSLRTKWGCDLNKLKSLFGYDIIQVQKNKIDQFKKEELILIEKNIIYLSRKGKFLADEIISELFLI